MQHPCICMVIPILILWELTPSFYSHPPLAGVAQASPAPGLASPGQTQSGKAIITTPPQVPASSSGAGMASFSQSMDSDFYLDGSGQGSAVGIRNLPLMPYMKALSSRHLRHHGVLIKLIDYLIKVGWSDDDTTAGLRIASESGSSNAKGSMPHFNNSFTTFLAYATSTLARLEQLEADRDLREAWQGLIATVTGMMHGNQTSSQWLITAHLIMGRLHRYCTTLQPSALSADPSFKEVKEAENRAASVAPKKPDVDFTSTKQPRSFEGPPMKRFKQSGSNRQNTWRPSGGDSNGCPFHGGAPHPVTECKIFLSLASKLNQKGTASADHKG
jgi:hypothetical protein